MQHAKSLSKSLCYSLGKLARVGQELKMQAYLIVSNWN